ncbi:hypothetical protein HDK90DRAFT_343367 [Phyllosticta capitalensis]|uniref:Uncharacterized protein n=1 Tax=Phyllosticta capitalensis TaxID=121624 RepID=A0ABR1YG73_9PEZI
MPANGKRKPEHERVSALFSFFLTASSSPLWLTSNKGSRIQEPFLNRSHQHHHPTAVPSITIQTRGRVERPTCRLRLCLASRPSSLRHNPGRLRPQLSVPSTRADMKAYARQQSVSKRQLLTTTKG